MNAPTVLIVDCDDTLTFNLYQQVGKLGARPVVLTCDTPLAKSKKLPATGSSSRPARNAGRVRGLPGGH